MIQSSACIIHVRRHTCDAFELIGAKREIGPDATHTTRVALLVRIARKADSGIYHLPRCVQFPQGVQTVSRSHAYKAQ